MCFCTGRSPFWRCFAAYAKTNFWHSYCIFSRGKSLPEGLFTTEYTEYTEEGGLLRQVSVYSVCSMVRQRPIINLPKTEYENPIVEGWFM